MKRTIKLASVLLLIAVISMTLTTMVSANGGIDAANIAGGLKGTTSNAQNDVTKIGNQLIGIITTVGVVVAVIILLVLGIKYMMGSASEKAEYKKTMIPYIVGAVLIFAGTSLVRVIYSLSTSVSTK
mgnify:CR=1 FL=1